MEFTREAILGSPSRDAVDELLETCAYSEREPIGSVGEAYQGVYKVGVKVLHCYDGQGRKIGAYVDLRGMGGSDESFTVEETVELAALLAEAAESAKNPDG